MITKLKKDVFCICIKNNLHDLYGLFGVDLAPTHILLGQQLLDQCQIFNHRLGYWAFLWDSLKAYLPSVAQLTMSILFPFMECIKSSAILCLKLVWLDLVNLNGPFVPDLIIISLRTPRSIFCTMLTWKLSLISKIRQNSNSELD